MASKDVDEARVWSLLKQRGLDSLDEAEDLQYMCGLDPEWPHSEKYELFVGNLPYADDLSHDDWFRQRGLFALKCENGRRKWPSENEYTTELEWILNAVLPYLPEDVVKVHKIINPFTFEHPDDVTDSFHCRPYAFVRCKYRTAFEELLNTPGNHFYGLPNINLRIVKSKGIPENVKRIIKKCKSPHPLEIAKMEIDNLEFELQLKLSITEGKCEKVELERKFDDLKGNLKCIKLQKCLSCFLNYFLLSW